MAKRPRVRVQPSTLAKRPRVRVQPSTLQPSIFNLGQKATRARSTFNPLTFNLQPLNLQLR
ncbi:MAG: hypothetical protein F6K37_03545 [Moorea sp. SIO4E2]|uniref:hypothetical protein n=1 Tax=Moorena sp. SIO4E2 TaxID=2607826 RepID=UPI0013BB0786|nr:hypothetical protein [Moorena sp. SIO4E2]NEQ05082.1 hypothetical protein [Moorena sp. SIO4E2]